MGTWLQTFWNVSVDLLRFIIKLVTEAVGFSHFITAKLSKYTNEGRYLCYQVILCLMFWIKSLGFRFCFQSNWQLKEKFKKEEKY